MNCDRRWIILFVLVGSFLPKAALAVPSCTPWVAKIVSVEGTIEARRADQANWEPATVGATFCPGDRVRVSHWRAAIVLSNDTIVRLDQGTSLTFTKIEEAQSSWVDLLKGIVHFMSRVPRRLTVTTPFVNAAVEGTEFVIQVDSDQSTVWVFEGRVRLQNPQGNLLLAKDQAAVAQAGLAPRRIVVRPRDAVQWAIHYPPLVDTRAVTLTGPTQQMMEGALAMYHGGDLLSALQQMKAVPITQRDAQFLILRAGLFLSVGRIKRANEDITQAMTLDPGNGLALALQAVIAVVHNDKDAAVNLAKQAVERIPDSSVPHIALSYAYQAAFDVEKALASAREATRLAPNDGLAWSRVAELWLSQGYLDRALEAAEKAVAQHPDLARTQTVLGFASLSRFKMSQALTAFEKAIEFDQADPLPRLGLGLARIKQGQVAEGRREIEIAASLDPNNSLIRSYLGKAYFEERRDPLAASQLEMAKALDPKDPTAYFYDAIRKQTVNRPVEALHDLQQSIELNDNRAVYRSSLLLDQDEAARSAAIGRIYSNLGFGQRALFEGWSSLTTDPSSHSAHRLLADSYASRPRHEIARVSELLQTQLLQPVNINNLQPQLSQASLQILEGAGPSALSFNEFNPLFMRDRLAFLGNVVFGNHNTIGDDIVLSGMLADRLSLSLGQFHYETDGFRENNNLEHDIYNVFLQGAIHPKVNLQVEYRHRKTEQGNLELNFDPDDFSRNERRDVNQDVVRLGARFSPAPHSDVLASFFYADREEKIGLQPTIDIFGMPAISDIDAKGDEEGFQFEAQYAFRHDWFSTIIGGGIYDIDVDEREIVTIITPFMSPFSDETEIFARAQDTVYGYANVALLESLTGTLGVSYDSFKEKRIDIERVNPKVGVQWDITNNVRLRLVYLQTVKRALAVNQTIEPTQVAGFNQFFDDLNGTRATRYGIGVDATITENIYGGIELSRRDLEVPSTPGSVVTFRDRQEALYRAYVYWTPHPEWAANVEFEFDQFKPSGEEAGLNTTPFRVNTMTLPLVIRHFHPSGLFGHLKGTLVHQDVDHFPGFVDGKEDFFLVDAGFGYRLPKRRGILSLEVRNLFDTNFRFQDHNIQMNEPVTPRFIPDRTVIGRVTLSF